MSRSKLCEVVVMLGEEKCEAAAAISLRYDIMNV